MNKRISTIFVLVLVLSILMPVQAYSADTSQSAVDSVISTATDSVNNTAADSSTESTTHSESVSATDPADIAKTNAAYLAGNPEEVAVVILYTNDAHTYYQSNIGYDGLALYKKELESQYDNVLLVDAGDAIQGTSIGSISKGIALIDMMNHLGYDLAIPGNHEFDFGFEVLDDCAEKLDCGYVCANFCTSDGKTVFEPWRIIESGGLKIGFVGAVIPDTFTRSAIKDILNEVGEPMYDFLADETGDRLSKNLQEQIDKARENGADYVILVSHLGNNESVSAVYASDKIVAKLTGLNAVIDAHTHEVYNTTTPDKDGNMIPLSQAGAYMKGIGTLTIYKDGRLEARVIDTVPAFSEIPYETVVRGDVERNVDPDMKKFMEDIVAPYQPLLNRKIGELSVDLIKVEEVDYSRTGENGLCDFVADAFRSVGNTQIGLTIAGAVRTNLYAGDITYQDIVDILPFCNNVVTARVTGQMILDALEFGVSFLPNGDGGFPQISGITFTINKEIPTSVKMDEKRQFISIGGERRISDVKIGDEDLDPNGSYTITVTQYLLTGGNGYTMFNDAKILTDLRLADNEVVTKYIEDNLNGKIPDIYEKALGRIKWKAAS